MSVVVLAGIDAFFIALKNMWLERKPDIFTYGGGSIYTNGISNQPIPSQSVIQQIPSQPVIQQIPFQPVIQQNPPPLPPGRKYYLDKIKVNKFLNDLARQQGYDIVSSPYSNLGKLPPEGKKIRPKSQKTQALEELDNYVKMGIDIEDNRPYDPCYC